MVDVTVTYGGQQYLVTVPDTFGTLPQEQQRNDIQRFLGEQYPGLNITPPQTQPVDTSFGGAFRYGFDMPLENIAGTMEDFFGVDGSALRNAIETNPNYRPASADFINPPEGAFTVGGYAPGYLPRTVAENIGQYGAALGLRLAGAGAGGAIGTAIAPGAGTTAGALIGGFSLPTIFEAMQIASPVLRERLKNQNKTIDEATTDDYVIALTTAGFTGLANVFGTLGVGKIKGILTEAVTEGVQSVIQQTGETVATDKGLTIDPKQAVGEGIIGGATRGAFDAGVSGVKTAAPKTVDAVKFGASKTADAVKAGANVITDPKGTAQNLFTEAKQLPFRKSVKELKNNPRLAESDARVSDMFEAEKLKINETKQGTDVAEDVVFKNIQDRLKNTFKDVADALFRANKITGGEKKVFNQIVSRAAKHNRALTAPIDETSETDINEDISGGFQSDVEFINNLDLDQSDKDTLLDALLDLETVTEAGMKNRSVGALTLLIRKFGSGAGASAGAMLGGGVGAAVGATAVPKSFEAIAQRIDSFLKLNRPKVLKRVEQRRKAAELIGRDYGNTPKDLADLIQRLLEQQVAVNTKQDKQTVDPEVQKLTDYLNEIGAPRAGGWLETVRQYVQKAVEGLGVAVTQEDILATIARLQEIGMLTQETADDLVLNRGGQITIPKLMQLLTDATLASVRERAGITPDAQAQAEADAARQDAQSRRDARIQQGIEDNRRVLDASKTALEANTKIPKAEKALLNVALANMRLDLGRNPVEAIQNIVKDLRKSGVDEASIQAYILPYATRVAQQQQQNDVVFSQVDPIPEIETVPEGKPNPVKFNGSKPIVEGQSKDTVNKHGLNPHLRVETNIPEGRDKPLFTQKTNNKNAPAQIENIDTILERHPDVLESPEAFIAMLADALASDDVPVPPFKLIQDINGEGSFELLNSLTSGQLADANTGFQNASEFRQAYLNGRFTPVQTGKLFFWSFLSRGISPYRQESMFIDAYSGIDKWIQDAADGKFNLEAYYKWAKGIAPQGSGLPGAGGKSNLNAFGRDFLIKMSQDAGLGDGRSRLQVIHDMMSDPNSTAKEIRRQFLRMGEGVGIDNKVVSFTLLVSGYQDVMVLDRVQLRNMFNDGRFGDLNLWDGIKVDGKVVTGSTLANLSYGARGLLIYEAIEQALQSRLKNLYERLGRPQDASIGRYHWETWVASSGQEASHATINAILNEAKGVQNPILNIRSKEGEYGTYAYGAQYGLDSEGASFLYSIPNRGTFKFTVPQFQTFLKEIKKKSNGVEPKNFKGVEAAGEDGKPWYDSKGVNKDALREQALKYGKEIEEDPTSPEGSGGIRQVDGEDGTNENVPDRPPTNQSDAPNQNQEGILTDYSIVDPQQEFDFDVQGIPSSPTTDGQAAREIKENLEEAEGLIEFGKPGSPFEDGIKNYDQLNAVLTAIGLANKLFIVDSQAEMKRVAKKFGSPLPSNTTGIMGLAIQGRTSGKTKAIIVLKQGKGGKSLPQDAEFLTAIHETAHAIEFDTLKNYNNVRATAVSRPYGVSTQYIQESSLRDILNDYLTSLGRDKRVFDNDPIVKEIREIQSSEIIRVPEGQSGILRPNLDINFYMDVYDKAEAEAKASGKELSIDREGYKAESLDKMRQYSEREFEKANEFIVDPLLFMMAEPKIAKVNYPNIYKFIQDVMNGKDPMGIDNTLKKDGKIKFYTAPFSIILAAVLSAMGMAEDEEEMPPVSPPNRGALTPQPGALSI